MSILVDTANHQNGQIDYSSSLASLHTNSLVNPRTNSPSDWAVLNQVSLAQLNRILGDCCQQAEIQQACALLEAYHAVYRLNWMHLRAQGYRGNCLPPTIVQLEQISVYLQAKTKCSYSCQQILTELQAVAQQFRSVAGVAR